jgi:hypothetical protein
LVVNAVSDHNLCCIVALLIDCDSICHVAKSWREYVSWVVVDAKIGGCSRVCRLCSTLAGWNGSPDALEACERAVAKIEIAEGCEWILRCWV